MARKGNTTMEVKFVDLTQNHVEEFQADIPDVSKVSASAYMGAIVRAAVKAGWLIEPKIGGVDKVGGMKPGEVKQLANAIMVEFGRVMELPPS
jgi:hypothetical protein